jgi:pyruvate-formate lyase-activating enzyme
MKNEVIDFSSYLNLDVKIFPKERAEPITGRVTLIKKNFISLVAKKAIKKENKIVYVRRSVKKDSIERILTI